jgi:trehalose 2-sulfotransferase
MTIELAGIPWCRWSLMERGAPAPQRCYAICTNPRSGSWLLSDGLAATLVAGNPREWFNVLEERNQKRQWRSLRSQKISYCDYLQHIITNSSTSNGVCGIKLHYYQLPRLMHKLQMINGNGNLNQSELLSSAFPRLGYIWLTRQDKARQAISFYRACQTNEWWKLKGCAINHLPDRTFEVSFDPVAIAAIEQTLTGHDLHWQRFFRQSGVTPLTLNYEDLTANYYDTVIKILSWLGIANIPAISIRPTRFQRQSDFTSEQWLARYLEFKGRQQTNPTAYAYDA